jgi:hypothetical protein
MSPRTSSPQSSQDKQAQKCTQVFCLLENSRDQTQQGPRAHKGPHFHKGHFLLCVSPPSSKVALLAKPRKPRKIKARKSGRTPQACTSLHAYSQARSSRRGDLAMQPLLSHPHSWGYLIQGMLHVLLNHGVSITDRLAIPTQIHCMQIRPLT